MNLKIKIVGRRPRPGQVAEAFVRVFRDELVNRFVLPGTKRKGDG